MCRRGNIGLTRADLEHPLHVRRDAHLLRQLRALRKESRSSEIVDLEHRCAALSPAPLELAGLDLDEAAREQRLTEQQTYGGVDAEDSLCCRGL